MRWPFALRSTVDALDAEVVAETIRRDAAESRAYEWHRRLLDAEKRLMEVIDLKRTTPEAMANIFAEWGSKEQASFFNRVAELTDKWEMNRCFQFAYIMEDLSDDGKRLIEELSDYVK